MDRRSLLATAAALLAGCGQLPSTDTSPSPPGTGTASPSGTTTPSPSPTEEPAASPTTTPTDEPPQTESPTATETETETPALSEREERAERALTRAIDDLGRAVEAYVSNEGDSLADVDAATRAFSRPAVLSDLSDADDHITTARRLVSARQRPRLEAVENARRFLGLCIDTQPRLIAAFGLVEAGRENIDGQEEVGLENTTRDLRTERRNAEQSLSRIEAETDAARVAVVPAITESDYDAKVDQFAAEVDGFGGLADFFDRFLPAITALNDAERFDRVDRERRAREEGQAAADAFDTLETDLRAFAGELSDAGASLEAPATALADLAETKAADAREIVEDNS
jgi:hypothetical protein